MFLIEHQAENDMLSEEQRTMLRAKDEERLKLMTFYCTRHECLRHFMLSYFGEKSPNYCGNCSSCRSNYETRDISVDAQKIISCIYRLHQRGLHFGVKGICDILRGSKAEKYEKFRFSDTLSTYGLMSDVSEKQCRQIIDFLLSEDWLSLVRKEQFQLLSLNRK